MSAFAYRPQTTSSSLTNKNETSQLGALAAPGFYSPEVQRSPWWENAWNWADYGRAYVIDFPIGFLDGLWHYVSDIARDAWQTIKSIFTGEMASSLAAFVYSMVTNPVSTMKTVIGGLWDRFRGQIQTVVDWVERAQRTTDPSMKWNLIGNAVGYVLAMIVIEFCGGPGKLAAKVAQQAARAISALSSLSKGRKLRLAGLGNSRVNMDGNGNGGGRNRNNHNNGNDDEFGRRDRDHNAGEMPRFLEDEFTPFEFDNKAIYALAYSAATHRGTLRVKLSYLVQSGEGNATISALRHFKEIARHNNCSFVSIAFNPANEIWQKITPAMIERLGGTMEKTEAKFYINLPVN